jgi:hypothetical protein
MKYSSINAKKQQLFSRISATLLLILFIPSILPAQTMLSGKESGKIRLEQYIDRASIEQSKEQWNKTVQDGIMAALAEWESHSIELRENAYDTWLEERNSVQKEYELTGAKAYVEWTAQRYFDDRAVMQDSTFAKEIKKIALSWQYKNVDGTTTREITKSEVESARGEWNEAVTSVIDNAVAEWKSNNGNAATEIGARLFTVPVSDDYKESVISSYATAYQDYVKNEFKAIASAEENNLMAVLLYDNGSLKQKSESEAANAIARQLSTETTKETTQNMERLFTQLDTTIESVAQEEIELAEKNWLDQFTSKMNESLSKWNEAEEAFLVKRSDWERQSQNQIVANEELWAQAFEALEQSRKEWNRSLEIQIEQSRIKWQSRRSQTMTDLDESYKEYEEMLNSEVTQKEQLASVQVSIYSLCREVLDTAEEGVKTWYDVWGEKYDGVYSYWKTEDLSEYNKNLSDEFESVGELTKCDYVETKEETNKIRAQINLWKKMYVAMLGNEIKKNEYRFDTYEYLYEFPQNIYSVKQLKEAIEKYTPQDVADSDVIAYANALLYYKNKFIIDTSYSLKEQLSSNTTAFGKEKSLLSWFDTIDAYVDKADEATSELYALTGALSVHDDAYNGSIDGEYVKAQSLVDYWARQKQISDKVMAYVENNTSSEDTIAETKSLMDDAQQKYLETVHAYQEQVGLLKEKEQLYKQHEDSIAVARNKMIEAQTELKNAQDAYTQTVQLYCMIDISSIIKEINQTLEKTRTILSENNESLQELFNSYLQKLNEYESHKNSDYRKDVCTVLNTKIDEINSILKIINKETNHDEYCAYEKQKQLFTASIYYLQNGMLDESIVNSEEDRRNILSCYSVYMPETIRQKNLTAAKEIAKLMNEADYKEISISDGTLQNYVSSLCSASENLSETGAVMLDGYINELIREKAFEETYVCENAKEKYESQSAAVAELQKSAGAMYTTEKLTAFLASDIYKSFSGEQKDVMVDGAASFFLFNYIEENTVIERELLANSVNKWLGDSIEESTKIAVIDKLMSLIDKDTQTYTIDFKENYLQNKNKVDSLFNDASSEFTKKLNGLYAEVMYQKYAEQKRAYDLSECEALLTQANETIKGGMSVGEQSTFVPYVVDTNTNIQAGLYSYYQKYFEEIENNNDIQNSYSENASASVSNEEEQLTVLGNKIFDFRTAQASSIVYAKQLFEQLKFVSQNEVQKKEALQKAKSLIEEKTKAYEKANRDYTQEDDADGTTNFFLYNQSIEAYSRQYENVQKQYEQVKKAAVDKQTAEEIYDWAQNAYLHFDTKTTDAYSTPAEKNSAIARSLQNAELSLSVIKKIKDSASNGPLHSEQFSSYEESYKNYYLSRVLMYEINAAVQRQIEKTALAEAEVNKMKSKILRNDIDDTTIEKNKEISDFVCVYKQGDSYTFGLARQEEMGINQIQTTDESGNIKIVEQKFYYLGSGSGCGVDDYLKETITEKNVYGNEQTCCRIKQDALNWIANILNTKDSDYLNRVIAASLYLESIASDDERKAWGVTKEEGLAEIPEGMAHGIRITSVYNDYRYQEMKSAYDWLKASKADSDIAQYILYKNTVFNEDACGIEANAKSFLRCSACMSTIQNFKETEKTRGIMGVVGHLSAIGCIALSTVVPGLVWLGIEAEVTSMAILASTNDVRDMRLLVEDIHKAKYQEFYRDSQKVAKTFGEYAILVGKMNDEYDVLNKLVGKTDDSTQKISYDCFAQHLTDELLADSAIKFTDLLDVTDVGATITTGGKNNFEKLFNYISNQQPGGGFTSIQDACTEITGQLSNTMNDKYDALQKEAESKTLQQKKQETEYLQTVEDAVNGSGRLNSAILTSLAEGAWGESSWDQIKLEKKLAELYGRVYNKSMVRYDRKEENYHEDTATKFLEAYSAILEKEKKVKLSVRQSEDKLIIDDLKKQEESCTNSLREISKTASAEWNAAKKKLTVSRAIWEEKFSQEREKKLDQWKHEYASFLTTKRQWMMRQYVYAQNHGNSKSLVQSGADAEEVIKQTLVAMESNGLYTQNNDDVMTEIDTALDDAFGEANFNKLFEYASAASNRADFAEIAVKFGPQSSNAISERINKVLQLKDSVLDEMQNVSANLAAEQSQLTIKKIIDSYIERLAGENKAMSDWEVSVVQKAGYQIDSTIHRNAVIDSTLTGTLWKEQSVHKYNDFVIKNMPDVPNNLLASDACSAAELMIKVNEEQKKIETWGIKLFGEINDGKVKEFRINRTVAEANSACYKAGEIESSADAKRVDDYEKRIADDGWDSLSEEEQQEYTDLEQTLITIRDGAFGRHVGYAPAFKTGSELDLKKTREENVKYKGLGEIGKIMLDFQWNSIEFSQGYAELAKPMSAKKLWHSDSDFFTPPSLRDITGIAMDIIGAAVGQSWLISNLDDLFFGMEDIFASGKNPAQVGIELGKKLLCTGITSGLTALGSKAAGNIPIFTDKMPGFAGKALNFGLQAGVSAGTSYTIQVAASYLNALSLTDEGFSMDWDTANSSWTDSHILAGAFGAGVTGGLGALNLGYNDAKVNAMSTQNAATQKFYRGAINLGVSTAGKIAEYGTYLAFAGGDFAQAFDDMGGLTFNVANLGSIFDMIGLIDARTNATGQSELGKIAQSLGGAGFLEVTIGSNGLSSRFGTGGIDLGGNLYQLGKRLNDKAALEAYAASHGNREAATIYNDYVYGDWTQENTAARLASGIDSLEFVEDTDYTARTTDNGRGGRIIRMKDTGNDLNNAVLLGHESYRDGIVDSGNADETIRAVIAHTAMAANMESWGADVSLKGLLGLETAAYKSGNTEVLEAIAENCYDSSADYWLFKSDGRIVDDGTYYFSREIVNEKGEIVSEKITDSMFSGSRVAALVKAIGFDNVKAMFYEMSSVDYTNADFYDKNTLKEAGLSDKEIWLAKKNGTIDFDKLGDNQKNKLIGEAYMKASGAAYNYDSDKWENGNAYIPGLNAGESLGVSLIDGNYKFFTAGINVIREPDTFEVANKYALGTLPDDNTKTNYDLRNNTSISFWVKDLFSNETFYDPYNYTGASIDKMSTNSDGTKNITTKGGKDYFGNTIVSDTFNMRLISYNKDTYGVNTVGLLYNASTISGKDINILGLDGTDYKRYLWHPISWKAGLEGCFATMSDYNVGNYTSQNPGTGAYKMQQQLNWLYSQGIYLGYQFSGTIKGKVRP